MRTKTTVLPPVPPSFFLSLTASQQKQLGILLTAYKAHYANYFSFSGEMIKKNGFVMGIWENVLYHEVLQPKLITKNMFRLLLFVWFLQHSPKFKDTRLVKEVICAEIKCMGNVNRLWPQKNLKYLVKYGWLSVHLLRYRKKQYFVSDKGACLITAYTIRFQELYNNLFEPLSL